MLAACTRTVVVESPMVAPTKNRAMLIASSISSLGDFKCIPWTGRETVAPLSDGDDSVLCVGQSQIVWCGTPDDGKAPECKTVADWTPPPQKGPAQPKIETPPPEPPKAPEKAPPKK